MKFPPLLSIACLQLVLPARGVYGDLDAQWEWIKLVDSLNTRPTSLEVPRGSRRLSHVKRDAVIAGASPCTQGFEPPKYQISAFQFNKTAIESGDRSMAHFMLRDAANNWTTSCTTPYLQDPNKPMWNRCLGDDDAVNPNTKFKYTASKTELEINQVWICEVENKTHPRPYLSTAKTDLSGLLDCVDDPTQTRCTIPDDSLSPFSGDYVTPIWKPTEVEIPPSKEEAIGMPWNPTPCIGPSFSYPNWDVKDFSYEQGGDGELVSFRLSNHASNQSVACTIQEGEWDSCDGNSTHVRFSEGELSVNQTWICNGGERFPKDVTFLAVGSALIDVESSSPTVIKGSLLEPIELTPNVAPEGVNHPGCLKASETPSWIVTSWVWNEIWRNGYNTGNLTATFYNPATGFNLTCTGDGEELNRDGRFGHDRWWGCSLSRSPFSDYQIVSSIKLNPLTEVFSIRQKWYCDGHDDKLPAGFNAVGDVNTSLECSWKNDTATNMTTKTCYQKEFPLTVHGEVEQRTELAKDEFFELAPEGYSCTIASVLATQWQTGWSTDTLYVRPTFADDFKTNVRFGIQFLAIDGYQFVEYEGTSITPFLPTTEPGRWYDCKDYVNGIVSSDAWARYSLECKWQLDIATGYFAINHTWFCDDKDPEHPIIFHGEGSKFYDYSCYVYRRDDEFTCDLTGLNPPPVVPTQLSWKSVPAAELRALA